MKLIRADALLGCCNQSNSLEPKAHRDMARLENGSDLDGERFSADVALISPDPGAFAFHLADSVSSATVRTNRAIGP
jgi:hypothetical protein